MGMKTHHHSVICTTQTETFFLNNETVERLILRRNPQTLTIMRNIVEEKLFSRVNLGNFSRVELYNALLWRLQKLNTSKDSLGPEKTTKDKQRDLMIARLVKLFIADKMPLIEPRVPDIIYHKTKSSYRERRSPSPTADVKRASLSPKPAMNPSVEFRLAKAKIPRRKARSRRQLERLHSVQEQSGHLDLSLIIPPSSNGQKSLSPNKLISARQSAFGSNPAHGRRKTRSQTAVGIVRSDKVKREILNVKDSTLTNGINSTLTNGIFKLTQGHICGDLDETDSQRSDTETVDMQNNAEINFAMSTMNNKMRRVPFRPKSAPFKVTCEEEATFSSSESDTSVDCFDWETSQTALELLEDKIRKFHDTQDNYSQRMPYRLREMRRFTIQV